MEGFISKFPELLSSLIRFDVQLANLTTFNIGGNAEFFFEARKIEQLQEIIKILRENRIETKILAGGSNILISDENIADAVLSLRKLKGFSIQNTIVSVNAGENLAAILNITTNAGLSGFETLAGIPGTIGGALIMNAGGKYGNISDCVKNVTILDRTSEIRNLTREEIKFGNRQSSLSEFIVLGAEFELNAGDANKIRSRKQQILAEKQNSQPYNLPSAGCVFKNPENISAGMLIEQAGLKGFRIGGAIISNKHANYILNEENAKATDILQLIRHIRQKVYEMYKINLELEIKLWNLSL
ncbi:MAG: UDP-N-acetylmuramate dehydrogenase [Planctomycetes bacterium]|nr:UDP-N-acetylmuramate dehydrogenase [Planctomycetota bacterium]